MALALVSDDLLVHLSSATARTLAMWVWLVSLESPLELSEVLTILVKLGLELSQLRKLHGFVILRWRVDLSVIPRCPGIFPCYGDSAGGGGVLRFISSCYLPVDVEAFPRRVVAVGIKVGIRLSGVETSASLFRQPPPERIDCISPGS